MHHSNRMIYIFGLSPFDITLILIIVTLIIRAILYSLFDSNILCNEITYGIFGVIKIITQVLLIIHVIFTHLYIITPSKYEKYSCKSDEWLKGAVKFKIANKEYNIERFKYPLIYIIYITYIRSIIDKYGLEDTLDILLENRCIVIKEMDLGKKSLIVKRGYAVKVTDNLSIQIYLYPDEILTRIRELQKIFHDISLEVVRKDI